MANVIINGVGTIGKRVADSVLNQEDMNLVGVSSTIPKSILLNLNKNGFLQDVDLYASEKEHIDTLENSGLEVKGAMPELLDNGKVDVVVDSTPPGIDEKFKEIYENKGVKAIFQGGADTKLVDTSFSTLANYEDALGEDYVKVVSCNTTSLARTVSQIHKKFKVNGGSVSLVRRGGDPHQEDRGPINSINPVPHVPSHHGVDLQDVLPNIKLDTLAVKVPTTLAHVHMVSLNIEEDTNKESVLKTFEETPRVKLFSAEKGYTSTAKIMEAARDLKRPRSDLPEVGIWEETVSVKGNNLYWIHMVHQESIVAPENIDAIRAMLEMADKEESIKKTDRTMPY